MPKKHQRKDIKKPISLLLVEGETDEIFYDRIKLNFLNDIRCTTKNLRGLFNVNKKVINCVEDYSKTHIDERIKVYCCFDRESRYGQVPGFDIEVIKKYIKENHIRSILSVDLIVATQQIESWFFYDIQRIYSFLRVPKTKRNAKSFHPPEQFGYKQLNILFEKYGHTYSKGKRSEYFIRSLNIEEITSNCRELKEGIDLIRSQADDLTNHLF